MKRKTFVRRAISFLLVIALVASLSITTFAATYSNSASKSVTIDSIIYNAYMSKTANSEFVTPITETQAYHTKGTSTTLSVSTTYSTTWTGSGSFTAGYNKVFIELAGEIGVSKSTSDSVNAGVSITIPETFDSGYYRIELRCPKYTVKEICSQIVGDLVDMLFTRSLSNMPGTNAGYYILSNYQ